MKPFRFLSLALPAVLIVAALSAFSAPESLPPEALVFESGSHSITINYLDTRGDYRRAQVSVQPVQGGDRPAWRGELKSFRLIGNGQMSRADQSRFERAGLTTTHILSSGFGSNAMVAPSRRTLIGIELTPVRGRSIILTLPGHNPVSSRDEPGDTDPPPPEDPPKEPAPKEPAPPDPGDDDLEDFCNPFGKGKCDKGEEEEKFPNPFKSTGGLTGNDRAVSFTF